MNYNKRLKEYRLARKMSMSEFAVYLGVHHSLISKIENNTRKVSKSLLIKVFGGLSAYTCSNCGGSHEGTREDFLDQVCA